MDSKLFLIARLGLLSLTTLTFAAPVPKTITLASGRTITPGQTSTWLANHNGMKHLEELRSHAADVHQCADPSSTKCKDDVKKHLNAMIDDVAVVYFADICAFYMCRHGPFSKSLPICQNINPNMAVSVTHYRQTGLVDYSDIAACANETEECALKTRQVMTAMASLDGFSRFISDLALYFCEHAEFAHKLACCIHVPDSALKLKGLFRQLN